MNSMNNRPQQRRCGPLNALEIYQNPESKWVVLFHGYGADSSDLAGLVDYIPLSKPCNWLFPNGPLSVPIGPGWTGRAWWSIRMTDLPGDWSQEDPPEMKSAVDTAFKMLASMKFEWSKVILGGFSQGAMLATELFLRAPETPAGLMCLSGTLLKEKVWEDFAKNRKGSQILMSHGEMDQVLPHRGSVQLQKFFENQDLKTEFISFRGGHEIPLPVIKKMQNYIEARL